MENKKTAREYNSKIIQELINEITPEETERINNEMERIKKQTVVEWLQEALEDTILTHEQIMQTIGLFEQAKDMEKEQIMDACEEFDQFNIPQDWEQYYNEKYGK